MMKAQVRKLLLVGAVIAVVAMVAYEPARESAKGAVSEAQAPAGAVRKDAAPVLVVPEKRGLAKARGELFGAPPAPPPPKPVVAATPAPVVAVAPPLPYRFAGRVRKGTEEEFLVSKGELIIPVRPGDVLDGTYRVVAAKADGIDLVYLPLNTPERVAVSSALDMNPPPPAIAAPALPPVASDGKPAQLRWDGPKQVRAGAAFDVALRVSTAQPLRAAPLQLRYAPAVLEAVAVKAGAFVGEGSFAFRVSPDGAIFVGATAAAPAPGADAELVVVTFRPLKAGTTAEVSMSALSLQGAAGRAIAHEQPASFRTAIQ
jgi:hypothetical protein